MFVLNFHLHTVRPSQTLLMFSRSLAVLNTCKCMLPDTKSLSHKDETKTNLKYEMQLNKLYF